MAQTLSPFSHPLYVMLKPVGSHCNLACDYCYYLEKSKLYAESPVRQMTDELLERFTREYIESQTTKEVLFTWHGGEPLMRPLSFYRKALQLQQKYAGNHLVSNCIQTNGTLLTDEWCRFLHDNGWLVGISIDGPQEFHDEYRRNLQGRPSWIKVMKGVRLLKQYDVMWNAMAVVNSFNADYPLEFYHFFKELGCSYIQFTPIVERLKIHEDGRHLAHQGDEGEQVADFSVKPEQWGKFCCQIFDEWVKQDVGKVYVQLFDGTLANWCGVAPGLCTMGKTCGHAAVMEFNGDVYACDHFVFPEYKLGNIYDQSLLQMMYGERQNEFYQLKGNCLSQKCRQCDYLFACHGECPKNRFVHLPDEKYPQNYLCQGYHQFFAHVAPYMDYMKQELMNQRPPANVMQAIKDGLL